MTIHFSFDKLEFGYLAICLPIRPRGGDYELDRRPIPENTVGE
jgi:hypothetical protein